MPHSRADRYLRHSKDFFSIQDEFMTAQLLKSADSHSTPGHDDVTQGLQCIFDFHRPKVVEVQAQAVCEVFTGGEDGS